MTIKKVLKEENYKTKEIIDFFLGMVFFNKNEERNGIRDNNKIFHAVTIENNENEE